MSEHKRRRSNRGYYIALIGCAAAIWITGYVFYRNQNLPEEVPNVETYEDFLAGSLGTEDVAVISTEPAPSKATKPNPTQGTTPTTPVVTEGKRMKTMSPVAGEEIFGYSMEALSYNQTTRDWRVHNGVDLAAEAGSEVCAAADGEVYTVYEDDAMGATVVIRHDDGFTTRYSSLAENLTVKPGDKVTMGQTIGYAADSAIVESTLGSHVHFSVPCYDETIVPAAFLSMGQ